MSQTVKLSRFGPDVAMALNTSQGRANVLFCGGKPKSGYALSVPVKVGDWVVQFDAALGAFWHSDGAPPGTGLSPYQAWWHALHLDSNRRIDHVGPAKVIYEGLYFGGFGGAAAQAPLRGNMFVAAYSGRLDPVVQSPNRMDINLGVFLVQDSGVIVQLSSLVLVPHHELDADLPDFAASSGGMWMNRLDNNRVLFTYVFFDVLGQIMHRWVRVISVGLDNSITLGAPLDLYTWAVSDPNGNWGTMGSLLVHTPDRALVIGSKGSASDPRYAYYCVGISGTTVTAGATGEFITGVGTFSQYTPVRGGVGIMPYTVSPSILFGGGSSPGKWQVALTAVRSDLTLDKTLLDLNVGVGTDFYEPVYQGGWEVTWPSMSAAWIADDRFITFSQETVLPSITSLGRNGGRIIVREWQIASGAASYVDGSTKVFGYVGGIAFNTFLVPVDDAHVLCMVYALSRQSVGGNSTRSYMSPESRVLKVS